MRKILLFIPFIFLLSCNPKQSPEEVDLKGEEAAIKEAIATLFQSIDDRDIDLFATLFTDDGVYLTNTPEDLFGKDTIISGWTQLMQMPEIPPFELISEPIIRIQPDGKTAIYSTQYHWELFTSLPLRQTFWLVKRDSNWIIDFFDFSVIPYNDQYPALNAAIQKE